MSALDHARSLFQGVNRGEYGYKMLAKMGWQEGDGIGKQRNGIARHIAVSFRNDNRGIGVRTAGPTSGISDAGSGIASLESVLAKLQASVKKDKAEPTKTRKDKGKKPKAKRAKAKEAKPELSTKGVAEKFAKKKSKRKCSTGLAPDLKSTLLDKKVDKNKKSRKAKKGKTKCESSPPTALEKAKPANLSTADGASEPNGAKNSSKVTHNGRYKRHALSKNVRAYSESDLAAVLCTSAAAPSSSLASNDNRKKEPKLRKSKSEAALKQQEEKPRCEPDKWWGAYFFRGTNAFEEPSHKFDCKSGGGFREDDQEDLAVKAAEKARQGKRGLGAGSLLKGIEKFKGTRVKFE